MKPGKDFIGVGAFVLIFNEKNQILLIYQKPSPKKSEKFANKWSIPGGTVEFGEICTDALRREIKEELNLKILDIKFLSCYDSIESDRHWIGINYTASTKEMPENLEPHKIKEIRFFDPSEIPDNISEDTRKCLGMLGLNKREPPFI